MKLATIMRSPIGDLTIVSDDDKLTDIRFGDFLFEYNHVSDLPFHEEVKEQLAEYFRGKRKYFEIPLALEGTQFQMSVWNALLDIPYGEVKSYKDIAIVVGCPQGSRAIGMANHNNPVPIIVPCHRVIGSSGKLVGYGGGEEIKRALLSIELPEKAWEW